MSGGAGPGHVRGSKRPIVATVVVLLVVPVAQPVVGLVEDPTQATGATVGRPGIADPSNGPTIDAPTATDGGTSDRGDDARDPDDPRLPPWLTTRPAAIRRVVDGDALEARTRRAEAGVTADGLRRPGPVGLLDDPAATEGSSGLTAAAALRTVIGSSGPAMADRLDARLDRLRRRVADGGASIPVPSSGLAEALPGPSEPAVEPAPTPGPVPADHLAIADCLAGGRAHHPPIRITEEAGDEGFVLRPGTRTYRPGSGVVAGSGTADDPYVIRGWCIDGEVWEGSASVPDQPEGLLIRDTDAHVVVRDVDVRRHEGPGIRIVNASNVTIADSRAGRNYGSGIQLERSRRVTVSGNQLTQNLFAGVLAWASDGATIEDNTVEDSYAYYGGFVLLASEGVRLAGNRVTGGYVGLVSWSSPNGTVVGNEVTDNEGFGAYVSDSEGTRIADNTVRRNEYLGLLLAGSDRARLAGNAIHDNVGYGLLVHGSDGTTIVDNGVSGHALGVVLGHSRNATLSGNELVDDGILLDGDALEHHLHRIDATNTVNGDPVRYVRRQDGVTLDGPAGQVILADADDVTVRNVQLTGADVGLQVAFSANATVRDANLSDGAIGALVDDSDRLRLSGSTVAGNAYAGVLVDGSANATLRANDVRDNGYGGLALYATDGATLEDNAVSGHSLGIYLVASEDGNLSGNRLVGDGIVLYGDALEHHLHRIDATNTVNGDPVRYVRRQDGVTLDGPAGQVILADADDVTVRNVQLTGADVGLQVAFSANATVRGVELSGNDLVGALVQRTDGFEMVASTARDNGLDGVLAYGSRRTVLRRNAITGNGYSGVFLYRAHGAVLEDNFVTGNGNGSGYFGGHGIVAYAADRAGVTVRDNLVADNGAGAVFFAGNGIVVSGSALVADNTVTGNGDGDPYYGGDGIVVFGDGNATLRANDVRDNAGSGIILYGAEGAAVEANTVSGHDTDLELLGSTGTVVTGNRLRTSGLALHGWDRSHYLHAVDDTNTVNGSRLVYARDRSGGTITGPVGQVIVVNSTGLVVEDVEATGAYAGVQVAFSRDVRIEDATLAEHRYGVLLESTDDTAVLDARIDDSTYGVLAYDTEDTVLRDATVEDGYDGISLHLADGATVQDSRVTGTEDESLAVWYSDRVEIAGNRIRRGERGVLLYAADRAEIRHNLLEGHAWAGLDAWYSRRLTVEDNVVAGNGEGISIGSSSDPVVHGNNIEDNRYEGLEASEIVGPVDARDNWWGHATGPSGGERDACTGTPAVGLGDAIRTHDAGVCFEMWRTSPNPAAGPSR